MTLPDMEPLSFALLSWLHPSDHLHLAAAVAVAAAAAAAAVGWCLSYRPAIKCSTVRL